MHSHNCAFRAHTATYEAGAGLAVAKAAIPKVQAGQFAGYQRENGQVGTRNMIALVSTVNCSATAIRRAAEEIELSGILANYPNVDGIVACTHSLGCGMAAQGPGWGQSAARAMGDMQITPMWARRCLSALVVK